MRIQRITPATMVTLTRFVMVPIFVGLFLTEHYQGALGVFLLAGITDFIDGFMARRFHMRSQLGSMLDPLADKFLMLCSFVMLSIMDYLPWMASLIVIGRDLLIVLGVVLLKLGRIKLYYKPTWLSKITTTVQILLLALGFFKVLLAQQSFLQHSLFESFLIKGTPLFIQITLILTLLTAGQYAFIAYKFYRYGERIPIKSKV